MGFEFALFNVDAEKIDVLELPHEFFQSLLDHIQKARKRIVLSCLYLGTGKQGQQILDELGRKQRENPEIEIHLHFDYNRSMRWKETAASISKLLVGPQIQCFLYHSSYLNFHKKAFLPKRWDEVFGVFHIKSYIFDDTCIISGANLSEEYFTNRQDRYMIVQDKNLCDFLHQLLAAISTFSFKLDENGETYLPESIAQPWNNPWKFREQSSRVLNKFVRENIKKETEKFGGNATTNIKVMLQAPEQSISTCSREMDGVLNSIREKEHLYFASGYFNLSDSLSSALLRCRAERIDILACSKQCNGFKTAKGAAKYVCDMYECILDQFTESLSLQPNRDKYTVFEYFREKWTYHAKGLWIYSPVSGIDHNKLACRSTVIGSSNFGMRSQFRDLELQYVISTEDPKLQQKLHSERRNLFKYQRLFSRKSVSYPKFIPVLSKLLRTFF